MSTVKSCLAGPKSPQDQVFLSEVPEKYRETMQQPLLGRKKLKLSFPEILLTNAG